MPFAIPRSKLRESPQPAFRNTCWELWGNRGNLLGVPLIITGTTISILEIVRIIYGITNRGINNYVADGRAYTINDGNLFPILANQIVPTRSEKFHYWPWSYAANLFGLVAIIAGIAGIISAYRRNYTSLFTFLAFSLLTAALSGYLIGYYSILIYYYNVYNYLNWNNRTGTIDTSYGLVTANLALSTLQCLFAILAFVMAFLGINGCSAKGLYLDRTKNSYAPPPNPRSHIVPTSYIG